MPSLLFLETFACQFVAWPFGATACTWLQFVPALAGFIAALALRLRGIGRLIPFLGGTITFYALAIAAALHTASRFNSDQQNWFLLGCLFLFPTASVVSLCGVLVGDLYRIHRKRGREDDFQI